MVTLRRPHYDGNLPSLHAANKEFQSKNGPSVIDDGLKHVILSNDAAGQYGIILVHCHALLRPDQAMVEFNGTSTPWSLSDTNPFGGTIVPQAWLIRDGVLHPYEFVFVAYGDKIPEHLDEDSSLVKNFMRQVEDSGLANCVGLRRTPPGGKECLEITRGSANIMIPSDKLGPGEMDASSTDTMWFYDPSNGFKKYRCRCVDTSTSPNNPNHNHIDQK